MKPVSCIMPNLKGEFWDLSALSMKDYTFSWLHTPCKLTWETMKNQTLHTSAHRAFSLFGWGCLNLWGWKKTCSPILIVHKLLLKLMMFSLWHWQIVQKRGNDYILKHIPTLQRELKGMSSSEAALHFMQEALALNDVPITTYRMFKVSDFF